MTSRCVSVAATAMADGTPAAVNAPARVASATPSPPGAGTRPEIAELPMFTTINVLNGIVTPNARHTAPSASA